MGEPYAIVHYDLAIAKPAPQIQAEESLMYDNVFVFFGAFPATFGENAKLILAQVLSFAKRVDFACDTYKSPSIKDIKRCIRGSDSRDVDFLIKGPDQKRPSNFQVALKSS